jgi:hypothetical protein
MSLSERPRHPHNRWPSGRPPNEQAERNRRLFDEWFSQPELTMAELGRREGLTTQRISKIIQNESRRRNLPSSAKMPARTDL